MGSFLEIRRIFFASHFPSIASSNLPIHFLALPLNRRVRQTLIILCSIENHHEKINSFFHTLLVPGIVFARRPTRFFRACILPFICVFFFLGDFFCWESSKKRRTETQERNTLWVVVRCFKPFFDGRFFVIIIAHSSDSDRMETI